MEKNLFIKGFDYYIERPVKCSVCGDEIEEKQCVYIYDWARKEGLHTSIIHFTCAKDWVKHPYSLVQERKMCNLIDKRLPGCVLVIPSPPALATSRGEMTQDWLKLNERPAETVIDRTVYAFTEPSIADAQIGNSEVLKEIEEKEKAIDSDFDGFLSMMKNSKPTVEHEKVEKLE